MTLTLIVILAGLLFTIMMVLHEATGDLADWIDNRNWTKRAVLVDDYDLTHAPLNDTGLDPLCQFINQHPDEDRYILFFLFENETLRVQCPDCLVIAEAIGQPRN